MKNSKVQLQGGNISSVFRDADTVIRTRKKETPTIHRFLNHLQSKGFTASPRVIALEAETEILSYMDGDILKDYPHAFTIEQRIAIVKSVATLLREFHDKGQDFEVMPSDSFFLRYEGPKDDCVMCHNDIAPYNMTFKGTSAHGIFDFDTICPAPRKWDIAYAVYRFASLGNEYLAIYNSKEHENRIHLVKVFCDAYGWEAQGIIKDVCARLQALVDLFDREVERNTQAFIDMKKAGHQDFYKKEIVFLKSAYKNDFI
ncbi:phosphotransferase [Erysipelothrix sp. HDW6C]|uniref:phosphotransferase n=1 Tax=Erysipelothrix sp. HDW6C TaxID=2714930 RepID=UPI0014083E4D|nr:phosphotransferase [Erysipelothrix sp. HDW6C]QIK69666.1 phosphotransferase [Erysipelothrix sp. HDW6C]